MFSIIIPAYNCESCLKRGVESVLGQTCSDWQLIIVDDGSSDGTPAIAQELCVLDERIRYIHQENGGVSAARNTGIDSARGDYILFLDADDYWEPDTLEVLRERVQHSGEDAVVVFNFVQNDNVQTVLAMREGTQAYAFDGNWVCAYLSGAVGKALAFSCWNKVFRRSVLNEHKIRFPMGITIGEDMIFTLQYLSCFRRLECLNRGLYHYTINTSSAMNSAKNYIPQYEKTAAYLETCMLQGQPVDQGALAQWALETLTFALTNPYVTEMKYRAFRQFYRESSDTRLVALARQAKKSGNFKRDVLSAVLRSQSVLALYGIVKANRHV